MSHSPYPGSHTLCGPSLSMVQSSRLPSDPTQSILSKQMLFPSPNSPRHLSLRADPSSATSRGDYGNGPARVANRDQR